MTITSITVVQGIALQPGPPGATGPAGPPGAVANIDIKRGWMTPQYFVLTDLAYQAGGVTQWDVEANPSARMTMLGGSTTMGPPSNVIEGAYYALRTVQDSTPHGITWDTHYHWPGGATFAQQPSNIGGAIDVFHFRGGVAGVLEFVGASLNIKA